ncbi:MAG TPA: nuclear transport factor 2 family protein [Nevskiaceae bacterium]|nr:nuclear transport factor 2 family protein [Nevskiaceae bacterium]
MTELERLADIEALKQLKARYCRLLDAKDWTAWRALFTDDFVSDTTASGGRRVEGGDAFVDFVRAMLGAPQRVTVHQVHAPEIEILSPTTARGIWALEDVVRLVTGLTMRGYGHYHETYAKRDGAWRFQASTLTRLRADLETPLAKLRLPARLLAKRGAA